MSEGVLATLFFGMYRCCYGRHACVSTHLATVSAKGKAQDLFKKTKPLSASSAEDPSGGLEKDPQLASRSWASS